MRKVYIPYYDSSVGSLFKKHGYTIISSFRDMPDIVCFTGGEDVSPNLYGHKTHKTTGINPIRDAEEQAVFNECKSAGIPMVGICRGGQLINVLNGGTMYQDVTNHTASHQAIIDGERLLVSSTHHQMMCPGPGANVIGVAIGTAATRTIYIPKRDEFVDFHHMKGELDIEVVVYGNQICFQPHPEYSLFRPNLEPLAKKFFDLIDKYCFSEDCPF